MKMMYQKLVDHPEILQKNLVLFSRMIKFEAIIRNIYTKIETGKIQATRMLVDIEARMRAIRRAERLKDDLTSDDEEQDQKSCTESSREELALQEQVLKTVPEYSELRR